MNTKEKTLAEQFRSLQAATHRYLRSQFRKAAEENRKEITDKIFVCLSEEEQKTMGSYIERVVEALRTETTESGEDEYDFPVDGGGMGFFPHMGGFGHADHRYAGIRSHGGERMNGFAMPF
jgi:hypothetical protein